MEQAAKFAAAFDKREAELAAARLPMLTSSGSVLTHPAAVLAAAWSDNAQLLATACQDGGVRVWSGEPPRSVANAVPLATGKHDAPASSVAWGGNSEVVSCALDGTLKRWSVKAGSGAAQLSLLASSARCLRPLLQVASGRAHG